MSDTYDARLDHHSPEYNPEAVMEQAESIRDGLRESGELDIAGNMLPDKYQNLSPDDDIFDHSEDEDEDEWGTDFDKQTWQSEQTDNYINDKLGDN